MAKKLKIDFTGVEAYVKCSEGEHIAVLREIAEKSSKSSGQDMLEAKFEVTKGTSAGATLYDNFVLSEKALWKLKGFLECLGIKADGKIAIDLNNLVGKSCIISVIQEEYNGSMKPRVDSYRKFELPDDEEPEEDDDDDEEEEEEEEEPPKKSKKSKKKPEPEEDEEEDDEEEEPPKKSKKKDKKKAKKKKDEDDDEDEWDEE